jgi:uncharacterized protein (DUF433 family)
MTEIDVATDAITKLSRAEKAQLLQWIARDIGDAFPGIEITQGVMGGAACIRNTRIAVWILEKYRRLGLTDAEILNNYPTLSAEDLANAWNYVRSHRAEIEKEIEENERDD